MPTRKVSGRGSPTLTPESEIEMPISKSAHFSQGRRISSGDRGEKKEKKKKKRGGIRPTKIDRYAKTNERISPWIAENESGRFDTAMKPANKRASSHAMRSSMRMNSTASPTTRKAIG